MTAREDECAAFERVIREDFAFLDEHGMSNKGTRTVGSGGRDSGYVSRYDSAQLRIEIGWSEFELSLTVLLKFNIIGLEGAQCYAYFEPLVEFLTAGDERAVVPYVAPRMRTDGIARVMSQRQLVFADGLEPVAGKLAEKVKRHLGELRALSADQLLAYHGWIEGVR